MELTNLLFCVCFAWKANTEVNIGGYNLYVGTSSDSMVRALSLGNVTNACYSVPPGAYYFRLTAFNQMGLESDPTEALPYVTPLFLEVIQERSLDGVLWEPLHTNYAAPTWPVEFFRLRVERRQF